MKVVVKLASTGKGRVRAWCPALPGCTTYAETRDEALTRIEELARGYIASLDVPLPERVTCIAQPEWRDSCQPDTWMPQTLLELEDANIRIQGPG